MDPYWNISAVDGRYAKTTHVLAEIASEAALNKYRTQVEIAWLLRLAKIPEIKTYLKLSQDQVRFLQSLTEKIDATWLNRIKAIEQTTNHDVKAVEYALKEVLVEHDFPEPSLAYIHFACTSEDINNLAYGMTLRDFRAHALQPALQNISEQLNALISKTADMPMMARTHGQAATPTTMGKEMAVFLYRFNRKWQRIKNLEILGKFNGATGNFNAHLTAFPNLSWPTIAEEFVSQDLGLSYNPITTQIESHDNLAEWCNELRQLNIILLSLCRDIWGYISLGYFRQKTLAQEVGSSTMPHKVNPIDFENAEGNFGISNALLLHLSEKLPISRWQRDLSDSTVLRSLGTAFGHSLIAYNALQKGLSKIDPNASCMLSELRAAPELLAEPVQTLMRKYGNVDAYDILKNVSRGVKPSKEDLLQACRQAPIPIGPEDMKRLEALLPESYLGLAASLAQVPRQTDQS
jgi:adenylosuccinate lyase